MTAEIQHEGRTFKIDLSKPLDISLSLRGDNKNPLQPGTSKRPKFYLFGKVILLGKVSEGASVNFNNIEFSPHGHGTHTECVGHISREFHSINQLLKDFFFYGKTYFHRTREERGRSGYL